MPPATLLTVLRRVLVPLLAVLTLGALLLAEAPRAQAPARASASAALVSGTPGRVGTLSARGDRRRSDRVSVDVDEVQATRGELSVRSSRRGGRARARASAAARSVSIFGGLVTAYGVRRVAEASGSGATRYRGRVDGLKVDGRMVGRVDASERYDIGDGAGYVFTNRGARGLVVKLLRATNGFPAGATVAVVTVRAGAENGAAPGAALTPAPTATPAPRAKRAKPAKPAKPRKKDASGKKKKLARRKAPKVPGRLTAKRFAFPVYGRDARIADDFGADRQIGAHQGNDVFAAFGAPVLAVTDGELFKVGTLPISGNRLWLRSDAGDEFFYAHLSAFSPAAVNGRRVKAGQVLGFTGNTGDAEPTPPHVHFEIHPGGGDAIDPFEILSAWQEKRDVPPGAWLTRYGSDTEQRPGALVEVRDFIAGE